MTFANLAIERPSRRRHCQTAEGRRQAQAGAFRPVPSTLDSGNGSGRAVSRILFRLLRSGENHLSEQPVPETGLLSQTWNEPLLSFLFGLAPDGVFRAASLALRAVRSYRTFSPSPAATPFGAMTGCLFSVALSVGTTRAVAARVYPAVRLLTSAATGYAASRPVVFGLSSPGLRRKRFSALPEPAIR